MRTGSTRSAILGLETEDFIPLTRVVLDVADNMPAVNLSASWKAATIRNSWPTASKCTWPKCSAARKNRSRGNHALLTQNVSTIVGRGRHGPLASGSLGGQQCPIGPLEKLVGTEHVVVAIGDAEAGVNRQADRFQADCMSKSIERHRSAQTNAPCSSVSGNRAQNSSPPQRHR